MLFKLTYQETKLEAPSRETTKALYVEASSKVEARKLVEENTPYNIEFIQPLEGSFLAYEMKNPDFHITEFK